MLYVKLPRSAALLNQTMILI
ncbi:hypothetical protein RDI58_020171 [Solanum bulbocastanum]|uniref:Uncharacterized protein n=1 Tax=Solanum bulbocastanum TaxID=147425 RepID=A0AAN8T643_SOLBU